jgi:hypothetical protein
MNARLAIPGMASPQRYAGPIMTPANERRRQAVCRSSSLPVAGSAVLGAGLNRSESKGAGLLSGELWSAAFVSGLASIHLTRRKQS